MSRLATVTSGAPRVIWPAPGLPAFLDEERRSIAILVEHDGDGDALRDWAARLALREVASGVTTALLITTVRRSEPGTAHPYAAQYLRDRSAARALFEVAALAPRNLDLQRPRTAAVYDLVRENVTERPHSVALLSGNTKTLRVAFATDLHVSHAWDAIAAAVDQHAPDLRDQFCHPQRLLAAFVEQANQLAARGELDLVVLGGDLVDHVYRTVHASSSAADRSNVQYLIERLAPLTVPVLAIPGNHDYRVNPWRPRAFGLGSVGIPKSRQAHLLKAAGMWEPLRLLPSDRTALRTLDSEGGDGLLAHLALLAPATDFHVDLRGARLAFFATGRDMVLRWRGLDWQRRSILARALPTTWVDPDSEGPSPEQVRWLAAALAEARNAIVFFHAPILTPQPNALVEELLGHIDPGDRDDHATQVAFERRLQRSGLRCGVSFQNIAPLIRALISVPGAVTTFSGHVHRSSRVEVDRASLRVRSAAMNSERNSAETLPLHIAASLGHVRSPGSESEPPGYLLAEFEAGTLRLVQRRVLERKG